MDNAGGHGTKDCIDNYIESLLTNHNIIVRHQIPRSPDTNLLDLGIWCGVQHHVEKEHHGKSKTRSNVGALARTIELAWDSYDSNRAFAVTSWFDLSESEDKTISWYHFIELPVLHNEINDISNSHVFLEHHAV